jgi:hypothetical protein
MEHYVTIHRFRLPHEAEFARNVLENDGIPTRLRDEHTVTMLNLYENALGGLRLEVPANDLDRARLLLKLGQLIPVEPESKPKFLETMSDYLGRVPGFSYLSPMARILLAIALLTLIFLIPLAISHPFQTT